MSNTNRVYRIGARFIEMNDDDRNALTLFLFSDVRGKGPGPQTMPAAA
jgi:hypothetical protein